MHTRSSERKQILLVNIQILPMLLFLHSLIVKPEWGETTLYSVGGVAYFLCVGSNSRFFCSFRAWLTITPALLILRGLCFTRKHAMRDFDRRVGACNNKDSVVEDK